MDDLLNVQKTESVPATTAAAGQGLSSIAPQPASVDDVEQQPPQFADFDPLSKESSKSEEMPGGFTTTSSPSRVSATAAQLHLDELYTSAASPHKAPSAAAAGAADSGPKSLAAPAPELHAEEEMLAELAATTAMS